ncbi:Asp-tRNA(Asn)/Glu-tRNA(Gln) amidotransferase subunit GatC [Candidatus Woesearchaeota archaeon]|nr:Asp-tRNA(Asn)/Glu-tRNA(Gln) amidotransferase subunit GatC [Candidatus Woesearchaeota archaeon]
MKIGKELVEKVAKNARIKLSEEEIKRFIPEFKEILETFSKLNEVNTDLIKPSFQPVQIKNVTRKDVAKKCLTQEEALGSTQHKKDGYFKGPKVMSTTTA